MIKPQNLRSHQLGHQPTQKSNLATFQNETRQFTFFLFGAADINQPIYHELLVPVSKTKQTPEISLGTIWINRDIKRKNWIPLLFNYSHSNRFDSLHVDIKISIGSFIMIDLYQFFDKSDLKTFMISILGIQLPKDPQKIHIFHL